MNPSLSFAKPAPIEMDEQELQDAARVIANWVGEQIEQANMPIQKFTSHVRAGTIDSEEMDDSGKPKRIRVIKVRWLDPTAGGVFLRVFTPPAGCDIDACERIMKFVLNACKGGR